MQVLNKSKTPLRIPLPGGKSLHLGPGNTGQITPKAADHPPLKKLVEAGQLEVVADARTTSSAPSPAPPTKKATAGGGQGRGIRHTGDR